MASLNRLQKIANPTRHRRLPPYHARSTIRCVVLGTTRVAVVFAALAGALIVASVIFHSLEAREARAMPKPIRSVIGSTVEYDDVVTRLRAHGFEVMETAPRIRAPIVVFLEPRQVPGGIAIRDVFVRIRFRTDADGATVLIREQSGGLPPPRRLGVPCLKFGVLTALLAAYAFAIGAVALRFRHVRWSRGLCPSCAYPRSTRGTCSECGARLRAPKDEVRRARRARRGRRRRRRR